MQVRHILDTKGSAVATIQGERSLAECAQRLVAEGVGALVITDGHDRPIGLVSERDIVSSVATRGAGTPKLAVHNLADRTLYTCHPDDAVDWVSRMMTQRRVRHVPVVDNGVLCGIISVGDVLKHKLEKTELELGVMRDVAIARAH